MSRSGYASQNRYNATTQAAKALLDAGELGTVLGGSATVLWHRDPAYYQARPWRGRVRESGGGVLINQAIHTLDLMEWLLGEVVGVRGHMGRYGLDGVVDVEDTAHVLLDHAGGARSVIFATVTERHRLTRDDRDRDRAGGPAHPRRPDGAPCRRPRRDCRRAAGRNRRPDVLGASHALLIADFYARLAQPGPFWIDPHEGTRSLRLVHRIYQLNTP